MRLSGGARLDTWLTRHRGPWHISAYVHNLFDRRVHGKYSAPGFAAVDLGRSIGVAAAWRE
jgi:hypothetical protein